jgi:hypothetical protein
VLYPLFQIFRLPVLSGYKHIIAEELWLVKRGIGFFT